MKILSGKHHTHEEIISSVILRCKEKNIKLVEIIEDKNFTTSKEVEVKIVCEKCGEETIRNFYRMYASGMKPRCKDCSNKSKGLNTLTLTKNQLQDIIDEIYTDRNFSFKILKDFEYTNNKTIVDIKCVNCGRVHQSRIDLLKQGRKSCKCSNLRSVLERDVSEILKELNVEFKEEYTFDDLKRIIKLRFDFGVKIKGRLMLIECDGIQHFEPTFGEKSFLRTLETDDMKNKYVSKNNIPLLRIKYDEENIKQKIIEFIELQTSTTIPWL